MRMKSGEVGENPARQLDFLTYNPDPDYSRPLPEVPGEKREKFLSRLTFLYGERQAEKWVSELERIIKVHRAHKTEKIEELEAVFDPSQRFTEQDVALITYGDLLKTRDHSPLAGLSAFLQKATRLREVINIVHILPFFPYSSDRGFFVTDFRSVDPKLGSWRDIEEISRRYRVMFDGVFNHISSRSRAFQEMLNGHPAFREIAIAYRSRDELTSEQRKLLVRPRTSDILTRFDSIDGPLWVWTTFSPDQIDLNFKNPAVLMRVLDTLLLYVRKGANLIRLDAVTYLWSEPGTPSANLEQTHEIIKLMRDVLDVAAPGVALVTETNVPHKDNVSYFGNGFDEAQMVYNFSLPPLVLHTFYREDATKLSHWVSGLEYPSDQTTFFNILDTHDGIGLMGVKGLLPSEDIEFMVERAQKHGAFVSYRAVGEEGQEPYEINSTWFSALNPPDGDEELSLQVGRFVASRAISLALRGVPGIYFHGMVGTPNHPEVVEKTGSKRDINRELIDEEDLMKEMEVPHSRLVQIVDKLYGILKARRGRKAFHPNAGQRVLFLSPQVFALMRETKDGSERVLTLTNISGRACRLEIPRQEWGVGSGAWRDLIQGGIMKAKGERLTVTLEPYAVAWLVEEA